MLGVLEKEVQEIESELLLHIKIDIIRSNAARLKLLETELENIEKLSEGR